MRDPFAYWPRDILWREAVTGEARGERYAIIASRRLIHDILKDRSGNHHRSEVQKRFFSVLYGDDLARAGEADWEARRREMARPISPRQAEAAMPAYAEACEALVSRWIAHGTHMPDLPHDASQLMLDGLWRAYFRDPSETGSPPPVVAQTARDVAAARDRGRPAQIRLMRDMAAAALQREGPGTFDLRRRGLLDTDTLALFIDAATTNTAAVLHVILWLVSSRPELQEQIRSERRQSSMPMTEATVLESLRLVPPIMQLWRDVDSDIEADGETIPGGFTAILSIYGLHRHRDYWSDPDAFRPERFLKRGAGAADPRHHLLPFGLGMHSCIGSSLAKLELTHTLSHICAEFDLSPNPDADIAISTVWDARMATPDPIIVNRRK